MPNELTFHPERLEIRDGRRMLHIPIEEIVWVEAAGNYVQIYTPKKTYLVRHTVKGMETKLDPHRFVRVRPSAIVAVGRVEALNARAGGDYVVVLGDATEIRTSRSYRERVEDVLGQAPGTARLALANRRRRRTRAKERRLQDVGAPHEPPRAPAAEPALDRDHGHAHEHGHATALVAESSANASPVAEAAPLTAAGLAVTA